MCRSKSVVLFAIVTAFLWPLACNATARGVGQGAHEADSGWGALFGGGSNSPGGVGQGQFEAGSAYGAAVPSGINSFAVGQAQHDVQGYYNAPAFEASPTIGTENLIARRPSEGRVVASDWRYWYANGEWFYQMPDNSWMTWENGSWVNATTAIPKPNAVQLASPIQQAERR